MIMFFVLEAPISLFILDLVFEWPDGFCEGFQKGY